MKPATFPSCSWSGCGFFVSASEQAGVNCYFWGTDDPFMNGLELETWADLQSEMNRLVCRINMGSVTEH